MRSAAAAIVVGVIALVLAHSANGGEARLPSTLHDGASFLRLRDQQVAPTAARAGAGCWQEPSSAAQFPQCPRPREAKRQSTAFLLAWFLPFTGWSFFYLEQVTLGMLTISVFVILPCFVHCISSVRSFAAINRVIQDAQREPAAERAALLRRRHGRPGHADHQEAPATAAPAPALEAEAEAAAAVDDGAAAEAAAAAAAADAAADIEAADIAVAGGPAEAAESTSPMGVVSSVFGECAAVILVIVWATLEACLWGWALWTSAVSDLAGQDVTCPVLCDMSGPAIALQAAPSPTPV